MFTPKQITRSLERLSVFADRRSSLNQAIDDLVLALRSPDMDGRCAASWQEVADALGVTRQAAWRMYRAVDDPS